MSSAEVCLTIVSALLFVGLLIALRTGSVVGLGDYRLMIRQVDDPLGYWFSIGVLTTLTLLPISVMLARRYPEVFAYLAAH